MTSAAQESIELAPHCSLTPAQARGFFAITCGAAFTIAGGLALAGYWPVLPFAGLEMTVLGAALRLSMRRREQAQRILVSDEEVRIESRGMRGCRSEVVFPRHWAQVKLRKAHVRSHPSRLTIESMGRSCEVGPFLTEEDRSGLARRLAGLIGKVSESPPLRSAPGIGQGLNS